MVNKFETFSINNDPESATIKKLEGNNSNIYAILNKFIDSHPKLTRFEEFINKNTDPNIKIKARIKDSDDEDEEESEKVLYTKEKNIETVKIETKEE